MIIDDLPDNAFADVLNKSNVVPRRSLESRGRHVLHVSDLIKVHHRNRFCPREFVLKYFDEREVSGNSLRPGMALLYATGNAIHEHVREHWMRHSAYRTRGWGLWKCRCGESVHSGLKPNQPTIADCCNTEVDTYHEYELYMTKYNLVGHPDFVVLWNNTLHIVEIKTIDRKDIDFDDMVDPLGDHTLQGTFYYWLMKAKVKDYKISPMIRYLYVDRDTKKLWKGDPYKEFSRQASPLSRIEPLLATALEVKAAVHSRMLPKRICDTHDCPRAKNCKTSVICFSKRSTAI